MSTPHSRWSRLVASLPARHLTSSPFSALLRLLQLYEWTLIFFYQSCNLFIPPSRLRVPFHSPCFPTDNASFLNQTILEILADEHAAQWLIRSDSALEAFQRRLNLRLRFFASMVSDESQFLALLGPVLWPVFKGATVSNNTNSTERLWTTKTVSEHSPSVFFLYSFYCRLLHYIDDDRHV